MKLLYSGDSINILLIGATDLRHVLLTMAHNSMSYKHIHVSHVLCLCSCMCTCIISMSE